MIQTLECLRNQNIYGLNGATMLLYKKKLVLGNLPQAAQLFPHQVIIFSPHLAYSYFNLVFTNISFDLAWPIIKWAGRGAGETIHVICIHSTSD